MQELIRLHSRKPTIMKGDSYKFGFHKNRILKNSYIQDIFFPSEKWWLTVFGHLT